MPKVTETKVRGAKSVLGEKIKNCHVFSATRKIETPNGIEINLIRALSIKQIKRRSFSMGFGGTSEVFFPLKSRPSLNRITDGGKRKE